MFFQVEAEACTWVALMYLPGRRRAANLLLQCEAWVCPPPVQLLLSLLSWQCDARNCIACRPVTVGRLSVCALIGRRMALGSVLFVYQKWECAKRNPRTVKTAWQSSTRTSHVSWAELNSALWGELVSHCGPAGSQQAPKGLSYLL